MSVGAFFKKTLPNMALTVASQLPGPVGMVAGVISNVLGKKIDANVDAINTAVEGADPNKIVELQEKDIEFKELNAKLQIDEELVEARLAEQDRENARARQIAVRDWTLPALAWTIIGCTFGLIVIASMGLTKGESAFVGGLIGYGVNMCQQVVGYFFGSSSDSHKKTDLLAQAVKH